MLLHSGLATIHNGALHSNSNSSLSTKHFSDGLRVHTALIQPILLTSTVQCSCHTQWKKSTVISNSLSEWDVWEQQWFMEYWKVTVYIKEFRWKAMVELQP